MARTKKNEELVNAIETVEGVTPETAEQVVDAQKVVLTRANRVAVSTSGDGFKADFYKTHKKITTVESVETGWEPAEGANKSAQREDFRAYAINHAGDWGIDWNPQDMRAETNKRKARYSTDEELIEDALALVGDDITAFVGKCPYEVSVDNITIDGIEPTTKSSKGTDLSTLGVLDGKYEKSGNWAWAIMGLCVTLKADDHEIYVSMDIQLVSGQLKKPSNIGMLGYTQTAWNTAVKAELISTGILKEEEKEEESK